MTTADGPSGIGTVGVVGCGLMGSGIAQVCAAAGLPTVVCELNKDALAAGMARLEVLRRLLFTLTTQLPSLWATLVLLGVRLATSTSVCT